MTEKDFPQGPSLDAIDDSRPQPGAQYVANEADDAATPRVRDDVAPREGGSADDAGRGEGVGQAMEVQGKSQGRIVRERFFRHKGALFGMTTIGLIAVLAYTAMGLGPIKGWWRFQNYQATGAVINGGAPTLQVPSWLGGHGGLWFDLGLHPFGQDDIGSDNFALVLKGVQTSMFIMLVMGLVALVIGVTVGALAGYYRGWVDMVLMRLTDMVITLPVLIVGAMLGKLLSTVPDKMHASPAVREAITKNLPLFLGLALGCVLWPNLARLTRSEFLALREREFVDSARVAGASNFRIITKHILPNAIGIVIVETSLLMAAAVVLESALSFLGFGIYAPNISLGKLISQYQGAFQTRPWLFWWPGLFIILIALSINFIGDGLRDAFDPRTKRIPSKRQMDKAEKQAGNFSTDKVDEKETAEYEQRQRERQSADAGATAAGNEGEHA